MNVFVWLICPRLSLSMNGLSFESVYSKQKKGHKKEAETNWILERPKQ